MRLVFAAFVICAALFAARSPASAETRSLRIYHVHTGEKAIITYKRDGRYIPAGLKKLDYILRDWRKDKETDMDPRMFDLLWDVYQASGSNDYIHIICGYRTGDTNSMLRGRSRASGVAKKSQHILGKAIDFYIPDVPLEKLREIGMKFQVGGVGYYPHSGSPFVHMDTGWVRAWPRMSRAQLVRLFPNGHTLHLPPDGKPLPGYQEALASYKQRVTADSIEVAGGYSLGDRPSSGGGNLLAALFGHRDRTPTVGAGQTVQASARLHPIERRAMGAIHPLQPKDAVPVASPPPVAAPVPGVRPVDIASLTPKGAIPLSPSASDDAVPSDDEETADAEVSTPAPKFADLTAYAIPIPQSPPERPTDGGIMTASVTRDAADKPAALVAMADIRSPEAALAEEGARAPSGRVMPVPGDRPEPAPPELTAYASPQDVASIPAALPVSRPHRPLMPKPSAIAAAARKGIERGEIVMASLTPPVPASRYAPASAGHKPARSKFTEVHEISRSGRLGADAAGTRHHGKAGLTRTALEDWARAHGGKAELENASETVLAARMGRPKAPAALDKGNAGGHSIDPQRFAAVSVFFPNAD